MERAEMSSRRLSYSNGRGNRKRSNIHFSKWCVPRFLGFELDGQSIAARWASAVVNRPPFPRRLLHVFLVDSAPDVHGTSNLGHHLDPVVDELRLEIPCENPWIQSQAFVNGYSSSSFFIEWPRVR